MNTISNLLFNRDDGNTLSSRINLSPEQLDEARQITNKFLAEIKANLGDKIQVKVKHWLQGSYKNHTLIRPVRTKDHFDIDAGIYLFCNAEKMGLSAIEVRDKLRAILQDLKQKHPEITVDRKTNCERIIYANLFHLDLPVYYFDENISKCKLANLESGWIDSDPKSLQDYFTKLTSKLSEEELARLRRVIRYLKSWVMLKYKDAELKRIPSIVITFFIAENYSIRDNDHDAFIFNAIYLAKYFLENDKFICSANNQDLLCFSQKEIEYTRKALGELKKNCELLSTQKNIYQILTIWSGLFEHLFPPVFNRFTEINALQSIIPEIQIRLQTNSNKSIIINNNQVQAYKGDRLFFYILNKNLFPQSATIIWRVKNQGDEAEKIYDLGHECIKKINETQEENCRYRGTHFVECIVKNQGALFAVAFIEVKIKETTRPVRNPPKRTYFKGK
ncbi:TPA: hypothetical protein JBH38_15205 [Legionella pneumophila]|nr:hypothetical protein [Legionella pneumophila]HAU0833427.1 hypothetical protein [Legionella pneumophila]HAU0960236.1 hypothetical protein [Legionella pneumophila]